MIKKSVRKVDEYIKECWNKGKDILEKHYNADMLPVIDMQRNDSVAYFHDTLYKILVSYHSVLGFTEIWENRHKHQSDEAHLDVRFIITFNNNGKSVAMPGFFKGMDWVSNKMILNFIDRTIDIRRSKGFQGIYHPFSDYLSEHLANSHVGIDNLLGDLFIKETMPDLYKKPSLVKRLRGPEISLDYAWMLNPSRQNEWNFYKINEFESGLSDSIESEFYDFSDETEEEPYNESKTVQAENLPDGWNWTHYYDGSGSICSPDGVHYFSYDLSTDEYIHPSDNRYRFCEGYPYEHLSLNKLVPFAEKYIRDNILCLADEKAETEMAETICRFLYEHDLLNSDIEDITEAISLGLKDEEHVIWDWNMASNDDECDKIYSGYRKNKFSSHKYDYYFNCSEDFSNIEYVHIFDAGEGIEERVCQISEKLKKTIIGKCLIYRYSQLAAKNA